MRSARERRSIWMVVAAGSLAWGLAACANNLAQELAWERWKKCRNYPGLTFNTIDRDGEIWVKFAAGASARAREPGRACLRQAEAEQAERGLGAGRAPRLASGPAPTARAPPRLPAAWKRGGA